MQPKLAQVLNTLAHEIRTPLAVSQGYLKLYLDGRLTNADDQRRAFQQTRDALGLLATLCTDMGRVSALSEAPRSAFAEHLAARAFFDRVKAAGEMDGAAWSGSVAGSAQLAVHNSTDLAQAVAIVAKAAFDEAREQPREVRIGDDGDAIVMLAGAGGAAAAIAGGAGAAGSRDVDFGKGGKGLKLIWAAFVLEQHRVQTWTHQDHRASAGFRFPMVQA
jgi:signal transduction histidine kinase